MTTAPEAAGKAEPSTEAAATPAPTAPSSAPSAAAAIRSEALFAGRHEVQIVHRGALYRLKQTALGKLILTK